MKFNKFLFAPLTFVLRQPLDWSRSNLKPSAPKCAIATQGSFRCGVANYLPKTFPLHRRTKFAI